ncbi:SMC-Scp complex subunit ScpB [Candidatus Kaiserbacteria bacterium]|nr:SMC-Scp complex subunit ScpB [Candidatus Kaiserbacteria bacterium]
MMERMLTQPAALEALLFASGEPMEKRRLASLMGIKEAELRVALTELTEQLSGRGVAVVESEGEVELRSVPEAADVIKKLRESELSRDLGRASLETLAAIAYRAGASRGEVDWVRGVNSSTSIRTLLLRGLIEGREDPRDKRRVRYTLTTKALAHLGLSRAENLPRFVELAEKAAEIVTTESAAEEPAA